MPKDTNKQKNNNVKKNNKKEKKTFFKDFKSELKKVIWLTPKQVVNNTVAVLSIVLVTAIIVAVLDMVFKTANDFGTKTLQTIVQKTEQNEENTTGEKNVNGEASINSEASAAEILEESTNAQTSNEAIVE